jgi:GTP pyrophosphokinase
MFGNRMIKLNWINHASISYLTDIKVTGLDRQGLINEITRIISNELSLNIKSFYIEAHDGLTEGSITLYVQDTSILNDALAKLKNVDGIIHVTRID